MGDVIPGRVEDANYDVRLHIGESRDKVIQALNISGFRIDAQGAPSGMTVCVKLLRTD
jgi:hypothetical protein